MGSGRPLPPRVSTTPSSPTLTLHTPRVIKSLPTHAPSGQYQNTTHDAGAVTYDTITLQWSFAAQDIDSIHRFQVYLSDLDAPAPEATSDFLHIRSALITARFVETENYPPVLLDN